MRDYKFRIETASGDVWCFLLEEIVAAYNEENEDKIVSVAQLIGVDKYGEEIYEGTGVTDDNTFFEARMSHAASIADGVIYKCEE